MVNLGGFNLRDGGKLKIVRDVGSQTQVYLQRDGDDYQLRLSAVWDGGNEYSAPVTIDKTAWHQVDIYIANETALGSGDGIITWWLDGEVRYAKTDCPAIEDTDSWVFGIANQVVGDAEEYGHIYVDDLVVWDGMTAPGQGGVPVVSNESPMDGSEGVSVWLSQLSFDIEDPEGDPMDYIVTTIPDIGSAMGSGVGGGTYTVDISGLDYGTTYHWFVDVSDGSSSTTREFTFTTRMNMPVISDELPENEATGVALNPTLSAEIHDELGGPLTWEIQLLVDGDWQVINSGVLPDGSGTVAASTSGIDEYGTEYFWRVQVYDSLSGLLVSTTYSFETKEAGMCFHIDRLKIKRKGYRRHRYAWTDGYCFGWRWDGARWWENKQRGAIEIKGTFDSSALVDLALANVMYVIRDGEGHRFYFTIPAGSFRKYGPPCGNRFRFRSSFGSVPAIDATFDFRNSTFMFRAKGVLGTEDITGRSIAIRLAMGPYTGREIVEVEVRGNDLVYEADSEDDCCPSTSRENDCGSSPQYFYLWNWRWR
jgi:hypothetical protein